MAAPTVNLSVKVNTQGGAAVVGAIVTARLSAVDFYDAVSPQVIVQPTAQQATADGTGLATLALFPNALGTENTFYSIEAWTSDLATLIFRTTCVLPDLASDLADLWGTVPAPTFFDSPPGPPSVVHITQGGTAANTAAGARANLGILDPDEVLLVANNLSDVADKAQARANLEIGAAADALLKANNLADVNDAAQSRANLGLEIGADVQAYDADTAKLDAVQSYTKAQRGTPAVLTSSAAAIAIDMSLGNNFSHTMTESTTVGAPSNMVAGQSGAILGTQHASAAKTLAFNAAWVLPAGGNGTITTTLGGKFMVLYSTFDANTVLYDVRNLT